MKTLRNYGLNLIQIAEKIWNKKLKLVLKN